MLLKHPLKFSGTQAHLYPGAARTKTVLDIVSCQGWEWPLYCVVRYVSWGTWLWSIFKTSTVSVVYWQAQITFLISSDKLLNQSQTLILITRSLTANHRSVLPINKAFQFFAFVSRKICYLRPLKTWLQFLSKIIFTPWPSRLWKILLYFSLLQTQSSTPAVCCSNIQLENI